MIAMVYHVSHIVDLKAMTKIWVTNWLTDRQTDPETFALIELLMEQKTRGIITIDKLFARAIVSPCLLQV